MGKKVRIFDCMHELLVTRLRWVYPQPERLCVANMTASFKDWMSLNQLSLIFFAIGVPFKEEP